MTRSGEFRVDLFHRLDVARIHLPPLRERPDDIRILFNYFLQKSFRKAGLIGPEVSDEALVWLKRYSWTGNVRELENLAEKVLVERSEERRVGKECRGQ